jgi:transposase
MILYYIIHNISLDLCPNAVITVDRFQVTKMLNEELNQARISPKKTAEELKISEREKLLKSIKECKYILLKREKDLREEQKEKLEIVKETSITLKIIHELKEEFTIYKNI